ncbi:diacylglycerol/lipid kinase family protein [Nitrosospira briensis]|uniref:diacylglycerol/lipid kinase family protein n=1 Tax=Nitrosospira briensis TaxID=35799 RepID=UPI0008EAA3E3|nr:diacylglycerol kinase family protein [Nitrosospira briensis]SFN97395.1 Diacylglycerol kinase family enzyme [Nitrosospira briensis]
MPSIADESAPQFFIILNAASGQNNTSTVCTIIEEVLIEAGRRYELVVVEDAAQLDGVARQTVERACERGGVVVVAGGDGSINTVAQATLGSGCPLGVLPQGTFNYFGREHGISSDTAEATRALLTASVQAVQVGIVNDRLFLVNASLGLYPRLLEDREAFKQQYGRNRLVAFASGLVTLLRHHQQLLISLEIRGKFHDIRTATLFVGNNRLQLEQLGLPLENALENDELVAIMLRPTGMMAMLWLLVRGALGKLGEAQNVISFGFKRMTIRSSRHLKRRVKVATDGEVVWMDTPLEFRVSPHPLHLLKPATTPEPGTLDTGPDS